VYTYFDIAAGKDQPWLGPNWTNGLGAGSPDAKWEVRFNMNIITFRPFFIFKNKENYFIWFKI
jgi:hypothetical protein